MALNTRGSVDPRWIFHNRNVALSLHLASVDIYNPANGTQEYDAEANTWTGTSVTKWSGRARIQTISAASDAGDVYNPTLFQNVKVQLAYGHNELAGSNGAMPDFRPNDRMIVTSAPYNTDLEKFIFVVTSVLNSSNPWEKTLILRADTELDPTEA